MEYPLWAPADLALYHHMFFISAPDGLRVNWMFSSTAAGENILNMGVRAPVNEPLLDRFIFASDAEKLWKLLCRTDAFEEPEDSDEFFGPACTYVKTCYEILADWYEDPKQTALKKTEGLREIANKARELASLLGKSSHMQSVQNMSNIRIAYEAAQQALIKKELSEEMSHQFHTITRDEEALVVTAGLRRLRQERDCNSDTRANAEILVTTYNHLTMKACLNQSV